MTSLSMINQSGSAIINRQKLFPDNLKSALPTVEEVEGELFKLRQ